MVRFAALVLLLTLQAFVSIEGTKIRNLAHYKYDPEAIKIRQAQHQVHPIIMGRRSLRHMSAQPIDREELMSLFEAARWAPSRLNLQGWRFVFAECTSPYWADYLDALAPGNREWAKDAAVLVVVLSRNYSMYKGEKRLVPSPSFDTGAAWMAMALEGTARGLVVHATGGFDKERVAQLIGLSADDQEDYIIETIVAIGNRAYTGHMEYASGRNEIETFISEGVFSEKLP